MLCDIWITFVGGILERRILYEHLAYESHDLGSAKFWSLTRRGKGILLRFSVVDEGFLRKVEFAS